VLLDVRSQHLTILAGAELAGRRLAPPGSTLKPLVLSTLLVSGRLSADESYPCAERLRIGGRVLDCTHPPIETPMQVETALAYSCNCFVAHMAERFAPRELAGVLARAGLGSRTGLAGADEVAGKIRPAGDPDRQRLQALGEDGILVTTMGLAHAYALLARTAQAPVLAGLEGAVTFGTAQHARIVGALVAGKTGSTVAANGERLAWFAGFMPSRAPEIVVVVSLPGRSGGADAAPVAGRIFEAYRAGKLP
jgi:cell division protein FtsI/penicillin-binding protein 2